MIARNTDLIKKTKDFTGANYLLDYSKKEDKEYLIGKISNMDKISNSLTHFGADVLGGGQGPVVLRGSKRIIYERPREEKVDDISKIEFIKPYMQDISNR